MVGLDNGEVRMPRIGVEKWHGEVMDAKSVYNNPELNRPWNFGGASALPHLRP